MSEHDDTTTGQDAAAERPAGPTDGERALTFAFGSGNPTNERERRQVEAGRALLGALYGRRQAAAALGRAHLPGGGGKPAQDRAENAYKQAQVSVDEALSALEGLL
jgi:hypothetical protein